MVDNSNPDAFSTDVGDDMNQLERTRKFMVAEARRNDKLRNRLVGLAKEAEQYGILDNC